MRLHIKVCPTCQRFALRLDGDSQWFRNQRGSLEALKKQHEVVSEERETCEECARKLIGAAGETS